MDYPDPDEDEFELMHAQELEMMKEMEGTSKCFEINSLFKLLTFIKFCLAIGGKFNVIIFFIKSLDKR